MFLYKKSLELHRNISAANVIATLKKLIQYQIYLPKSSSILELPFNSNVCLIVHRGLRIFDFDKKVVIKTISQEVDDKSVKKEIEAVKKANKFDFTPKLRNWNIQERWYEEDYIIGSPCFFYPDSEQPLFQELYHEEIVWCLQNIILVTEPVYIEIKEYLSDLVKIIDTRRNLIFHKKKITETKIEEFILSLLNKLNSEKSKIPLVFTHGDFSLVNILKTTNGVRVIDWADAGKRSALHDFYNYFLTELYYNRMSFSFIPKIKDAALALQTRIALKNHKIAETFLPLFKRYRWIYYIERIALLLERELNEKTLNVIIKSIDVFKNYENFSNEQNY